MATVFEYATEVAQMVGNAEVKEVEKANGVKFTGIVVDQGMIKPTVYVDQMFKDGLSVEDAASEVRRLAETHNVEGGFDPEKFVDYKGFVKERLHIRLYNKSTKAEVKRSAKGRGFADLIMVPYVNVEVAGTNGSIKVTKEHIERWGVTEKEVIDQAINNDKKNAEIQSLSGFMAELTGDDFAEQLPDGPMIVSNKERCFGASAIIRMAPEFKKRFKNGFFVLPSSVHEVLVIPKEEGMDVEFFNGMVREVNATTVAPEEVLADHAYEF